MYCFNTRFSTEQMDIPLFQTFRYNAINQFWLNLKEL